MPEGQKRRMGPLGMSYVAESMVRQRVSCLPASLRNPSIVLPSAPIAHDPTKPRPAKPVRTTQRSEWAHSDDDEPTARRRRASASRWQEEQSMKADALGAAGKGDSGAVEDMSDRKSKSLALVRFAESLGIADSTLTVDSQRTLVEGPGVSNRTEPRLATSQTALQVPA